MIPIDIDQNPCNLTLRVFYQKVWRHKANSYNFLGGVYISSHKTSRAL
jgi:hypothetical protein